MNKINNENILKIKKSYIIKMIIGLIIFVGSFIIFCFGVTNTINSKGKAEHLNEVILLNENKIGKKVYLNISGISSSIAKYGKSTNAYYYAWDKEYNYIVYLKESTAKKIYNKDLEANPVRIEGTTSKISKELKNIVIKQYNSSLNDGEEKLTIDNFNSIFGDVYLNEVGSSFSRNLSYYIFGLLFLIIGMGFLLSGFIRLIRTVINIKNISKEELKKIEKDINGIESKYYDKYQLYITKKYLLLLNGRFAKVNYSDILWMYPYEQKFIIIKGTKSIKIYTSSKDYYVFATARDNKNNEKDFEELFNYIKRHNRNIKLGYSKDNIDSFKKEEEEIEVLE